MERNTDTDSEKLNGGWRLTQWILSIIGGGLLIVSFWVTSDHWFFGSPYLGPAGLVCALLAGLIATHDPGPCVSPTDENYRDY
jgi:hypothetical protein